MKTLTIFRIFSYLLIPIAVLFGMMDFFFLISALANPALLLMVFMLACFVIYVFSSLQFLTKGIDGGKNFKPGMKDWLKVNGYVSLFMGALFLMNAIGIFFSSEISLRQMIAPVLESQPNVSPLLSIELFSHLVKIVAYCMFFISLVLLTHIYLNFRYLKQYQALFEEKAS